MKVLFFVLITGLLSQTSFGAQALKNVVSQKLGPKLSAMRGTSVVVEKAKRSELGKHIAQYYKVTENGSTLGLLRSSRLYREATKTPNKGYANKTYYFEFNEKMQQYVQHGYFAKSAPRIESNKFKLVSDPKVPQGANPQQQQFYKDLRQAMDAIYNPAR